MLFADSSAEASDSAVLFSADDGGVWASRPFRLTLPDRLIAVFGPDTFLTSFTVTFFAVLWAPFFPDFADFLVRTL